MGNDLVSACVFCAGLLLGTPLPPPPGYHVEVGFAYATAARQYEAGPGSRDLSDVTPKFALVGFGYNRPAAAGMGAGTPAAEWAVRVALGPSHDEQEQTPFALSNTNATGTGRFENFAVVLRYPVSARDSLEAGWNRHYHTATDKLDVGQERLLLSEIRVLSAERVDVGVGWRHRWTGFEAALSGRYVRPNGSDTTGGLFHISEGHIWGGSLEARARLARWTLAASAERSSGSLGVHEESRPSFVPHDFDAPVTLEAYRAGVGYAAGKREFFLLASYNRFRLPFVSFAILGNEVAAFESGYHPESRTRVWLLDLTARHEFSPGFRFKLLLRTTSGSETLSLTDPAGVLPAKSLEIRRSGVFGGGLSGLVGSPEAMVGFAVELALPIGR